MSSKLDGEAAAPDGSVFTIPPGRPFLTALAAAILNGDLPRPGGSPPDALDLPAITILLPTRRAARALQEAFLSVARSRALLLPRIAPIAEANEDLTLLAALSGSAMSAAGDADVPPAVSEIERRIALTGLVLRWSKIMRGAAVRAGGVAPFTEGVGTAAQAARLASDLARLMDEVETENASLEQLKSIVPETYSEHWRKTLEFLKIVLDWWPKELAERGQLSPVERRNRLILSEARRLAARATGPVIVAGVTGSIPATVELMRVVAGLPAGAIVLPGLDQHLDWESWQAIAPHHPEHPQFGLKRLLEAIGVAREKVRVLPGAEPDATQKSRHHLISEALRPAATTERWHAFISGADRARFREALAGISYLEAPTTEDEAEAIALIMREVAETPGRTAALIARDRILARRVATRLETWGIHVDDSAGQPLAKTPPGTFFDLVLESQHAGFAPVSLMALLKHPLTRLGFAAGTVRRAARVLEIAAFRTIYLGRGIDGIEEALDRAAATSDSPRRPAVRRLQQQDWHAARELVARLRQAFAPITKLCQDDGTRLLRDFVLAHIAAAEALAAPSDTSGRSPLWDGDAGEALSLLLAGLIDESLPSLDVTAADYPELYRGLLAAETVRSRAPVHPRLSVWGPFESRLQQADVVILGGLNEGTWPEAADPGPWLNRPMRQLMNLPQPEQRIGYAAHDFASLLGAPRVHLTRAQKIDGVPTVASRWLLRLEALLDGLGLSDAVATDKPWLAWAAFRNDTRERRSIVAPAPKPPVALRPRKLSVSDVESWIANPYHIFASKILALAPLPVLGAEPDAALRGSVIHQALARFAAAFPGDLPADPERELMRIARATLAEYLGNPRIAAFWLPRFERFAAWFAATEPARRTGVTRCHTEVGGTRVLDAPLGTFTLTARADRIDVTSGGLIITDYKSSASLDPLKAKARNGYAPQLALEAAIALASGFTGIAAAPVLGLRYISSSGGEPPGAEIDLSVPDTGVLARGAEAGLARLIAEFDRDETPYRAIRRRSFSYDYDDYAHLARAAEWASVEPDEE